MESKITSIKSRTTGGFTLVELMIASTLGLLVAMAVGLLSFYSSRSFVALANYVNMDQQSQLALDKMSKEIRQSHGLTAFSSTVLSFKDAANQLVTYYYEPKNRSLMRQVGGQETVF